MDPFLARREPLEQGVLEYYYRTERSWASLARWLSCSAALLLIASTEYRVPAGVVLMALSIPCQVVSWRAMRAAQRLEKRRIERLTRGEAAHG
jgi:predicted lipoprotein